MAAKCGNMASVVNISTFPGLSDGRMPSEIQASNLDLDPGPQRHPKATKLCHSGSPFSWVSKITYFHFTNNNATTLESPGCTLEHDHLTMATSKEPVPKKQVDFSF